MRRTRCCVESYASDHHTVDLRQFQSAREDMISIDGGEGEGIETYREIIEFVHFSARDPTHFADGCQIEVVIGKYEQIYSTSILSTFFAKFSIDVIHW